MIPLSCTDDDDRTGAVTDGGDAGAEKAAVAATAGEDYLVIHMECVCCCFCSSRLSTL